MIKDKKIEKIFEKFKEDAYLKNITDLNKEEYEYFLDLVENIKLVYMAAKRTKKM